jgi:hypothetical protein
MSPVPAGRFVMEDGELKLAVSNPTDEEFREKPELAIDLLLSAVWLRLFDIARSDGGAKLPDELSTLLWGWVYCGPPLEKKAGLDLAAQQDNWWDKKLLLTRIRERGRPIKSRHVAIKALFRKAYLGRSWEEITQRLCECGQTHDNESPENKLRFMRCQENIQSEVRNLKRMLRKCDIAFPPVRSARRNTLPSELVPQETRVINAAEKSSGALRVADKCERKHPAIAILLNGDSLPETEMTRGSLSGESDAWYMFNPWEPGWIPMWFPDIRTEPIGTKSELQKRRYYWFDKAFKHFAGTDWTLQGPLESQRAVVADTLLRMYRAARDEEMPEADEL